MVKSILPTSTAKVWTPPTKSLSITKLMHKMTIDQTVNCLPPKNSQKTEPLKTPNSINLFWDTPKSPTKNLSLLKKHSSATCHQTTQSTSLKKEVPILRKYKHHNTGKLKNSLSIIKDS
jgi:hypothetical protein